MPPTSLSLFGVEKSYKRGSRPVIFEIADQVGNDGGTTIWGLCSPWRAAHSPALPRGTLQSQNLSAVASDFFFCISSRLQASLRLSYNAKKIVRSPYDFAFAVRGGFEPPEPLRVRQFSKLLVSATHPPHREWSAKIGGIR